MFNLRYGRNNYASFDDLDQASCGHCGNIKNAHLIKQYFCHGLCGDCNNKHFSESCIYCSSKKCTILSCNDCNKSLCKCDYIHMKLCLSCFNRKVVFDCKKCNRKHINISYIPTCSICNIPTCCGTSCIECKYTTLCEKCTYVHDDAHVKCVFCDRRTKVKNPVKNCSSHFTCNNFRCKQKASDICECKKCPNNCGIFPNKTNIRKCTSCKLFLGCCVVKYDHKCEKCDFPGVISQCKFCVNVKGNNSSTIYEYKDKWYCRNHIRKCRTCRIFTFVDDYEFSVRKCKDCVNGLKSETKYIKE